MKHFIQITFLILVSSVFGQTSQVSYETFITGLEKPVAMTHTGDSRIFVVEQHTGKIKVFEEDGTSIGTFLSMAGKISTGGEQGLLGLAFHPNYQTNGYFYINYTTTSGTSRVCRFQVSADSNVANAATETLILQQSQPYANHNGGSVVFGPDGYLYVGLGDGGSGGDLNGYAQNGNSLLGKMLRLDIDGGFPYAIPADNPFVSDANVENEIWALGLRNPWKYSFDKETGDLWIGDVGQNAKEEIDFQLATSVGGENYGWNCFEGTDEYQTTGCGVESLYDAPLYDYNHTNGECSVTGGYVYRGGLYTDIEGHYFFSDYCTGTMSSIIRDGVGGYDVVEHADVGGNVVSFGEDVTGQLYTLDLSGTIKKIVTPNVVQGMVFDKSSKLISVYPNPSEGSFAVSFESVQTGLLQITDLNGQELFSESISDDEFVFNESLKQGVYILKLTTNGKVSTQKIAVR